MRRFITDLALTMGLCLACLTLVSETLAQQVDQITDLKNKKEKGTVIEMSSTEVTLDMAGNPRKYAVNEISRITFGDDPEALVAARNSLAQKNYNAASESLKKIDETKVERDVIKQDVQFYKALCLAKLALSEGGSKTEAITAMLAFVKSTAKNSYHYFEAAEILGDLAVASGKFDAAAKYYGDTGLGGAPFPEYKMRAGVAAGRALLLANKAPEALAKFEAVLGEDLNNPEASQLKKFAMTGKASALAETGKVDEAIALAKKVIAEGDPQDDKLFARANNALGNSYLKANKTKDALMAFLQTDSLFFKDSESHAEALFRLSKLWDLVDKKDRATEARNTLRDRYGGSIWANASRGE